MSGGRERAERTYSFEAQSPDPALHARHTGLEIIELMLAGDVPGSAMWDTAGAKLAQASEGLVVFEARALPFTFNFGGTAHGGWTATLLDSAMGLAVMSMLPVGRIHTTTELSIRYVRPITGKLGALRVEGRCLHAGRRMATAEGRVISAADGKLLAHGQTSCRILEARG
jgi:uncharacterized protein (TIGR00369 family)